MENDNSYSKSQEGPARSLTPLQTPQQTEKGRQRRSATWKATLTFSISDCVDLIFPQHVQADQTHSSMRLWFTVTCATSLLPDCPLPKATIRLMGLHMDNTFHVSGLKRNDHFFISYCRKWTMPRKKGRWVREGEHSQKGRLKKKEMRGTLIRPVLQRFSKAGQEPLKTCH